MSSLRQGMPHEGDQAPMKKYRTAISYKQSRLNVIVDSPRLLKVAYSSLLTHRLLLDQYVERHPSFRISLHPVRVEPWAPKVARLAAEAAEIAEVGPMAAVAGALAEAVMEDLLKAGAQIAVVENGGEVAATAIESLNVAVYAGPSPLSMKVGFELGPTDYPIGIATSSASVSKAINFGEADAAVVVANEASLADAAAKAVCNAVKGRDDEEAVAKGLEVADRLRPYIRGALVIKGRHVGLTGRLPRLAGFR